MTLKRFVKTMLLAVVVSGWASCSSSGNSNKEVAVNADSGNPQEMAKAFILALHAEEKDTAKMSELILETPENAQWVRKMKAPAPKLSEDELGGPLNVRPVKVKDVEVVEQRESKDGELVTVKCREITDSDGFGREAIVYFNKNNEGKWKVTMMM